MPLVEREAQLSILDGLISGRSGAVALISGAIAAGKTEFLQEYMVHAQESGAMALFATCSRAEQHLPLGVISQLLHSAPAIEPGLAAAAARLDRCMLDMALSGAERRTAFGAVFQQAHLVHAALLEAAARRPVVVCVDDIHLADDPSQQCLLYLVRRLRNAPVLLVFSEWSSAPHSSGSYRADLTREPYCVTIPLAPLSPAGTAELVRARLGGSAPAGLADECYRAGAGNPLLAGAYLEDAAGGRDSFRRAYLACLRAFGGVAVRLATAIAVLGPAQTGLSAELAGLTTEEAERTVRMLSGNGLLDGWAFRNPAVPAALLDDLEPGARRTLRHQAGRLLYQEGAAPREIAEQLVSAGPAGNESESSRIVGMLARAADDALAVDDVDGATRYVEAAFQAAGTRDNVLLRLLLNKISLRSNPGACARYSTDLATALAIDEQRQAVRPDDVHVVIRHLLTHDKTDEAIGLHNRLAGAADPGPDVLGDLRIAREVVASTHPVLLPQLVSLPEGKAPVPSVTADQPLAAAEALTAALKPRAGTRPARTAEHLLTNLRLSDSTVSMVSEALWTLVYSDRLRRADDVSAQLLAEATERSAIGWQAIFSYLRSEISLRRGDLATAAEHAARALSVRDNLLSAWGGYVSGPLSTALAAATALGDQETAERILRYRLPESTFHNRFGLHYLHARGRHHLAAGRNEAAAEDFTVCGDLMTDWGLDQPALVPWRGDLAEALLALDDPKRAQPLVRTQLSLLRAGQKRTLGRSLRVLAATMPLRERLRPLNKAAELLGDDTDRLELARTFGALGDAYRQLGDVGRARTVVRHGWDLAKECGAQPLCEAMIPGEPPEPEAPQSDGEPGVNALTAAERRVVSLAAEGHTNSRIAERLYVSVSTVEQHLTRAYRKLNIRRREDLVTVLLPTASDRR